MYHSLWDLLVPVTGLDLHFSFPQQKRKI